MTINKYRKRSNAVADMTKTLLIEVIMLSFLVAMWSAHASEVHPEKVTRRGLVVDLVMDRQEYVYGEPVFLYLVAHNTLATQTVTFVGEDSGGWQAGYIIAGFNDKNEAMRESVPSRYPIDGGLTVPLTKYQCLPGETVNDEVPLQRFLRFSSPGNYRISVRYHNSLHPAPYHIRPPNVDIFSKNSHVELWEQSAFIISNRFDITVTPFDEAKVLASVRELAAKASNHNAERQSRIQAVEALGYFCGSDQVLLFTISRLLPFLTDSDSGISKAADQAMKAIWWNPAISAFTIEKNRPRKEQAIGVIEQIGARGTAEEALAALKSLLESTDDEFRKTIEASMDRLKSHGAAGK